MLDQIEFFNKKLILVPVCIEKKRSFLNFFLHIQSQTMDTEEMNHDDNLGKLYRLNLQENHATDFILQKNRIQNNSIFHKKQLLNNINYAFLYAVYNLIIYLITSQTTKSRMSFLWFDTDSWPQFQSQVRSLRPSEAV